MLLLAVSTQRTIGLVIALIVGGAAAVYVLFNVFSTGKDEIGSEIELAPNRKPYFDDEILETKKLDLSLAFGAGGLAIIAIALPLYWLGEPGRQEGYVDFTDRVAADRGGEIYEAQCVACHGAAGVGGAAAYTVLDESGRFVSNASWTAPALNNIMYRFSEDEVLHILNYGRPQSPMPAWGGPGGGPLTSQQIEEILAYLIRIQIPAEQVQDDVQRGLAQAVSADVEAQNPEPFEALAEISADPEATPEDIAAAQADVDAALDAYLADLAENDEVAYGELLFNNAVGAGSYNCARCHTAGSSWNADDVLAENPSLEGLIEPEMPGGGGFAPSLLGVADQFLTAEDQAAFVERGCEPNLQYGTNGVCEPSGQMPGFGPGATDYAKENGGGLLTPEQVAAIVAYERSLQ